MSSKVSDSRIVPTWSLSVNPLKKPVALNPKGHSTESSLKSMQSSLSVARPGAPKTLERIMILRGQVEAFAKSLASFEGRRAYHRLQKLPCLVKTSFLSPDFIGKSKEGLIKLFVNAEAEQVIDRARRYLLRLELLCLNETKLVSYAAAYDLKDFPNKIRQNAPALARGLNSANGIPFILNKPSLTYIVLYEFLRSHPLEARDRLAFENILFNISLLRTFLSQNNTKHIQQHFSNFPLSLQRKLLYKIDSVSGENAFDTSAKIEQAFKNCTELQATFESLFHAEELCHLIQNAQNLEDPKLIAFLKQNTPILHSFMAQNEMFHWVALSPMNASTLFAQIKQYPEQVRPFLLEQRSQLINEWIKFRA